MPDATRLLAFDFGKRRIGIALGNTLTATASPLKTFSYNYPDLPWSDIDQLVASWTPALFLLGMPETDDDQVSILAKPIRAFAAELHKRYDKRVEFVNEAFTSFEAQDRLKQQRQQGRKKRVNKIEIDQQAAAVIAETWLEMHRAT